MLVRVTVCAFVLSTATAQAQVPVTSSLNFQTDRTDHLGALRKELGQALKAVSKDQWVRARRAAVAINANRCDEAAAIAAEARDATLMAGVKRACETST